MRGAVTKTGELESRWLQLCNRIAPDQGDRPLALFRCLDSLYHYPPRAYHNLDHVAALLHVLDDHRSAAASPDGVEFAIWLHDCVYLAGHDDNESLSAEVARAFLAAMGCTGPVADRVHDMILATRHNGPATHPDARLVADIDLSVLAVPIEQFRENGRRIREEYESVDDAMFSAGRREFLAGMLARSAIYQTAEFQAEFEARARENLKREIDALH